MAIYQDLALCSSLLLILAGCGSEQEASDSSATGGASPAASVVQAPPAELLESRPYESTELGALHGEIRIEGKVPERFPIGARKMKECSHFPEVEHLSDIIIAKDGKLQNAFVTIESGLEGASIPKPSVEEVEMDQVGCIYTPHVLGMQTGQKLVVKNSDPATHNVNLSAPKNGGGKNKGMAAGQAPLEFLFRRPDLVKLKCDIHPWMSANVHVSKHPWFAVSGSDGGFTISGVPAGKYVVSAQHEEFGTMRGSLTVEPGKSTGFALTFQAD